MKDVYNPDYYRTGKIEVADFIEDKGFDFFLGNVVKYVSRAGKKDGNSAIQDLKKAQWYLTREIEILSSRGSYDPNRIAELSPKEVAGIDYMFAKVNKDVDKILGKDWNKSNRNKKKSTTEVVSDDDYADMVATISMCVYGDDEDDFPYSAEDFSWGDSWDDGDGEVWGAVLTKYPPESVREIKRKPRKHNDKN